MISVIFSILICFLFSSCGESKLSNQKSFEAVIAEAVDESRVQKRGEKGEEIFFIINGLEPFSGWVKKVFDNGQVSSLYFLRDGKKDSAEIRWYDNGQKERELKYQNGKLQGCSRFWYRNGVMAEEIYFQDGNKEGSASTWYENGQLSTRGAFKNGEKLNFEVWLPNGSKCNETNYNNGNGIIVSYYQNGNKNDKTSYKNGLRHGLWTAWKRDGNLQFEWNYVNGKLHGLCTFWSNGEKLSTENFNNGKKVGETKWF